MKINVNDVVREDGTVTKIEFTVEGGNSWDVAKEVADTISPGVRVTGLVERVVTVMWKGDTVTIKTSGGGYNAKMPDDKGELYEATLETFGVTETQADEGGERDVEDDGDDISEEVMHVPDEYITNEGMVSAGENGEITFTPEFTKEEANYMPLNSGDFDPAHDRCEDCAHFIEGGGCKVVQGPIEPKAYCEEFFADIGIFGHKHRHGVEENLVIKGEKFNWDVNDASGFATDIREIIERIIRGMGD